MSCLKVSYKICVVALAILQLLIAIIFLGCGIAVLASFGDMKLIAQGTYTMVVAPAGILITAGVFMIILAIFGFFGACRENKCLLAIFFVFAACLVVLEIVGASMSLAMKSNFESWLVDDYSIFIKDYKNSTVVKNEVDWVQKTFKCCGSVNVSDWQMNNVSIPDSCCSFNSTIKPGECSEAFLYSQNIKGCSSKLHDVFFANLNVIGGVGLAFTVIQIGALISVVLLLCQKQEHYEVF